MKTFVQAAVTSLVGLVAFGLMVFLPAGTFDYWRGWAFIAVFAARDAGYPASIWW